MDVTDLWKPSSAQFINDPFPIYEKLRAHGSIFKSSQSDYVVLGYDECKKVLQDSNCITGLRAEWAKKMNAYAKTKNQSFDELEAAIDAMLIQMNTPPHAEIRTIMAKTWPDTKTIKLTAKTIANELVSELPKEFDAVGALCKKLPLYMICSILNLPREEAENYMNDGLKLVQLLDPYLTYKDLKAINHSAQRLQNFIHSSINHSAYQVIPLTNAIISEAPRTNTDPVNLLSFLFIAGFETTSTLLGSCLHYIIENKHTLDQIEQYGSSKYVKEILRLYSPVQVTGRLNTKEIELGGLKIPANSSMTLCVGAANRDPKQYEDASEIKWDRKKYNHLSFGYGMHHCLGAQLAELEAEALLEALFPVLQKLSFAKPPVLEKKLTIKSYQSLKMKLI